MEATQTQKAIGELARDIARALGEGWEKVQLDEEEKYDSTWRAEIQGPENQGLFLSSTWGSKGMLYVSGSAPKGVSVTYHSGPTSIQMNMSKSGERMAREITTRLLPEYKVWLAKVLEQHRRDEEYKNGKALLKLQVAELFGVRHTREDLDTIGSKGAIDVEVSSPTNMRLHGHCMYITLDQLKRFKEAVPELFEKSVS